MHTQLVIVGPKNSFKASRLQRFDITTDTASTIIDEIGNSAHAGEAKDVPNVTLTFSTMDTGIKIFSVLTGTDWTAYPAAGVDISALSEVDAIVYVKSDTLADYVKSAHVRKLQIRDMALNYSVDGESTEDYTAVGTERRWLAYDAIVDRFTTGTNFTLSQTPVQLKNGDYLISVISDGVYLEEVASADEAGEYSVSGTSLTLGAAATSQVVVVYHANPAGTNWTDVTDADMPAGIKGFHVYTTIAANSIPRVQNITINGSLNIQPVNEMGNPAKVVGYQKQVPTVEGTLSVLDTDTELISLLTTGATSSGVEWNPGEGCVTTTLALKVEIKDPCDVTTTLKTVYLDNITVVGDSYSVNVNGNATQNFNWRSTTGHLVIYSGAM